MLLIDDLYHVLDNTYHFQCLLELHMITRLSLSLKQLFIRIRQLTNDSVLGNSQIHEHLSIECKSFLRVSFISCKGGVLVFFSSFSERLPRKGSLKQHYLNFKGTTGGNACIQLYTNPPCTNHVCLLVPCLYSFRLFDRQSIYPIDHIMTGKCGIWQGVLGQTGGSKLLP
jgi:hypothetical protein